MARHGKPGPGQGLMFDQPHTEVVPEEITFLPSDFDPPVTNLADYYSVVAGAVKDIAAARSNQRGFSQLSNSSAPVKEFAYRLESEPEEAKRIVSRAAKGHYIRGQEKLNRQAKAENTQIKLYAQATGSFTLEEVREHSFLPPSIYEVELKYFDDPEKTPKEHEAARRQLYRRAKKHAKAA